MEQRNEQITNTDVLMSVITSLSYHANKSDTNPGISIQDKVNHAISNNPTFKSHLSTFSILKDKNGNPLIQDGILALTNGKQIVIAFAGTRTLKDWWNENIPAYIEGGKIPRVEKEAKHFTERVLKNSGGLEVNVTGHSLGGGIAEIIGILYGLKYWSFNGFRCISPYNFQNLSMDEVKERASKLGNRIFKTKDNLNSKMTDAGFNVYIAENMSKEELGSGQLIPKIISSSSSEYEKFNKSFNIRNIELTNIAEKDEHSIAEIYYSMTGNKMEATSFSGELANVKTIKEMASRPGDWFVTKVGNGKYTAKPFLKSMYGKMIVPFGKAHEFEIKDETNRKDVDHYLKGETNKLSESQELHVGNHHQQQEENNLQNQLLNLQ